MMTNSKIFISYSHRDKDWVRNWLLPRIEKEGLKTHIDFRDFEIGVPFLRSMERAYETCAKVLLVCTENWINSEFAQFESYLFQSEDPNGYRKKTLPLVLHECKLPPRIKILNYADFRDESNWDFELTKLIEQIKKDFAEQKIEKESYPPILEENVDIVRLPQTGYELFGRQKELALLNDAWESETMNVIAFVAYGGTGKSTLVNKWLEKMRWDNYRGARRIFAWSFYSQGTGKRVTSADLFINEALAWFGDENPEAGSPWDKGKRLANLIRQDKTLLILDGLEPLQSYLDVEKGKINDPALSVAVTELAKTNNGLCIITTREEIPDILRFQSSVLQLNLEQISDEAGRALLRVRGIRGTDAELEAVTRGFGNHALAINLLAEYLHLIPGHTAEKANEIPDLDIPEEQGKHPRRVIEAFATHFGDSAELELLHILGLFDRPVDKAAIDVVIQGKPIPGLTDHLHQISEVEWLKLLQKLRDIKLIAPESHHRPDTIDCHPLIREHFNQKLREKASGAWRSAHSRLYEYFKNLPKKELPDTLEKMEPLFMAVAHGCRAGRYQEALDDVYWEKINRKNEFYSTNKLGAFGADLSAISNFYDILWKQLNKGLKESWKANLLNLSGFRLRALGRLRESLEPTQAGLDKYVELKDWGNSAIVAGNLSELYLMLGDVAQAVEFGRQSVEFADRIDDLEAQYYGYSDTGDALYQAGNLKESEKYFRKLESIQKKKLSGYDHLFSHQGFQFCDLLLSQGQVEEVLKRANYTIKNRTTTRLLDFGLNNLSLGRAYLLQAVEQMTVTSEVTVIFQPATDYMKQAVDGLRKAGEQEFIVRGLIERAELYRLQEDYPSAWDDLEEAHDIAERGEMRLWLTDYHLEACRLRLAEHNVRARSTVPQQDDKLEQAQTHLKEAKRLVNETGYHRRDPELLLLQAQLQFASGDRENARIWLNKAEKRFDEMGIRMWDFEVRELGEKLGK